MKLKKILENLDKMPSTVKGFNETPKLSIEQKRKLLDMVSKYNELGKSLRMENTLITTAKSLAEISELAETYACNEAQDWFATEVVKNDFKRARGISETFQKIAKECHSRVQQLNALYEDMGHILERYYEIADPMQEVCPNPTDVKSQRGLPNSQPQTIMQEVKPNDKNVKSQRQLPSGGPATAQVKEVVQTHPPMQMCKKCGQPTTQGISVELCPACAQPNSINMKEVAHNNKNVKSQRNLPSGGPAPAQVKESEEPLVKEVSPNTLNLQSQRELPSGGPTGCKCPSPENPSIPVNPAGAGECNVKRERNVPQGGPASKQIKEQEENQSGENFIKIDQKYNKIKSIDNRIVKLTNKLGHEVGLMRTRGDGTIWELRDDGLYVDRRYAESYGLTT